ncbi:hypothetical protein [Sporichthya sp.]|uniref:hypothetical protein n=1 Tax=Sporichthya sp. TaxID=65475 RepID=UPI0018131CB4|nr:hypothetical protein [Sporichthya sp.]MBA3743954.1 hypothetical protein [Sporichthya sp.]
MTSLVLPLTATVLAGLLTYFCCVRPMRQGRCAMASPGGSAASSPAESMQRAELAELRAKVDMVRALNPARSVVLSSGTLPDSLGDV